MNKAIIALLVVFVGFWMFTDPHGLAQSAGKAGANASDLTGEFFTAVIAFVREL